MTAVAESWKVILRNGIWVTVLELMDIRPLGAPLTPAQDSVGDRIVVHAGVACFKSIRIFVSAGIVGIY
ncbi:hypothetical protein RRF57_005970 [Xylaria bambusicola]|uniref:Uncharacterized protein n=1 Tax=Xylaria bambusicola TaxID=326684 RepID=A0AAN7UDI1_9PEZI